MREGYTSNGYYGYVPFYHCWMLFATDREYYEYLRELES